MSRAAESWSTSNNTHTHLVFGGTTDTQHHELLLKVSEKSDKSDLIECLGISSRKIRKFIFH